MAVKKRVNVTLKPNKVKNGVNQMRIQAHLPDQLPVIGAGAIIVVQKITVIKNTLTECR